MRVTQHRGLLRQRVLPVVPEVQLRLCQRLATDLFQPITGLLAVITRIRIAAQITQHGASLYRGQLVLVAQHDQTRAGRQCVQYSGHHL